MNKKKRFALVMADGAEVRNIDDLKAHFDIDSVVREFKDGRLLTWLEDRYYDNEAEAVGKILPGDDYIAQKLYKIFKIDMPEDIARRRELTRVVHVIKSFLLARREERLNRLKQHTNDKNILANVDKVAFDQEDLADLLDADAKEIYLCANRFVIPLRMKNKNYIGVGAPVAVIPSDKLVDFDALNITFQNISFDEDYQEILQKTPPPPSFHVETKTIIKDIDVDKNRCDYTTTGGSMFLLHLSMFVQTANLFKSKIQIKAKGRTADTRSIFMVMSLGLFKGTEIEIVADGSDAKEAVDKLKELIDSNFDSYQGDLNEYIVPKLF